MPIRPILNQPDARPSSPHLAVAQMSPQQASQQRGCLFYGLLFGCLSILIVAGAVAAFTFWGMNKLADQYVDKAPMKLAPIQASSVQIQSAGRRVRLFYDAVRRGIPAPVLQLTQKELNILLSYDQAFRNFKGRLRLKLGNETISGKVSLPLQGIPLMSGRYLNAEGTFRVTFKQGILMVIMVSGKVRGQELPRVLLEQLKSQNLVKDLYKNPKNVEFLRRLRDVKIQHGRLVVVPRNLAADGGLLRQMPVPARDAAGKGGGTSRSLGTPGAKNPLSGQMPTRERVPAVRPKNRADLPLAPLPRP